MSIESRVHFQEHEFLGGKLMSEAYLQSVEDGYRQMAGSRVVIAGLARTIASILPATIKRIEALGQAFREYQVFIYENDSCDETPAMLQSWAERDPRVHFVSESLGATPSLPIRCASRADRMAFYRDRSQKEVLTRFPNADHVILVDMDIEGGWSMDGVANTFSRNDWDFVGSNGLIYKRIGLACNATIQYDAWAYRESPGFEPLTTKYVNQLVYNRGDNWVPLKSCFGGLGVYTAKAFAAGRYEGGDIEHVSFHRSMIRSGFNRIFLNPNQITVYGRKHRRHDPWIRQTQQFLNKLGLLNSTEWKYQTSVDYRYLLDAKYSFNRAA